MQAHIGKIEGLAKQSSVKLGTSLLNYLYQIMGLTKLEKRLALKYLPRIWGATCLVPD